MVTSVCTKPGLPHPLPQPASHISPEDKEVSISLLRSAGEESPPPGRSVALVKIPDTHGINIVKFRVSTLIGGLVRVVWPRQMGSPIPRQETN